MLKDLKLIVNGSELLLFVLYYNSKWGLIPLINESVILKNEEVFLRTFTLMNGCISYFRSPGSWKGINVGESW